MIQFAKFCQPALQWINLKTYSELFEKKSIFINLQRSSLKTILSKKGILAKKTSQSLKETIVEV